LCTVREWRHGKFRLLQLRLAPARPTEQMQDARGIRGRGFKAPATASRPE